MHIFINIGNIYFILYRIFIKVSLLIQIKLNKIWISLIYHLQYDDSSMLNHSKQYIKNYKIAWKYIPQLDSNVIKLINLLFIIKLYI